MPGGEQSQYFVGRVKGRDVAGIGSLPDKTVAPAWITHIRVDSVDAAVGRSKKAGGNVLDGPLDAPPAGKLAVLADPAGAVFCAWEAGIREGAQLVNEPRAWAMSALNTSDAESSKAFYGAVFGWSAESFGPPGSPVALWRLPGYVGGEPSQPVPRDVVAVMMSGDETGSRVPPHWSVDFWVDDADATAANAAKLGGRVVVPAHDAHGFRRAVLADPQGPVFSVSQLMTVGD